MNELATYLTPVQQRLSTTKYNRLNFAVDQFNSVLLDSVATFKAAKSDVNVKTVDTLAPFASAFQNPTDYGSPDELCYNRDGLTCVSSLIV